VCGGEGLIASLPDVALFEAGGSRWGAPDVVAWGRRSARWPAFEDRIRAGLGDAPVDGAARSARVKALRRARDLIAAEEAEAWLARWGLDVGRLLDWAERAVRADRGDPPTDAPIDGVVWDHLVLDGALGEWAVELAGAVALADTAVAQGLAAAFAGPDTPDARVAWVDEARRAAEARLAADVDVAAAVRGAGPGLTAVDVEVLVLSTRDAAAEAIVCVTHDGQTLADVGAWVGAAPQRVRGALQDLPDALRAAVLPAASGEVVGPVEHDGQFVVVAVTHKASPDPSDPAVSARVVADALRDARDALVVTAVRWVARP
jgi:hypothetical protein